MNVSYDLFINACCNYSVYAFVIFCNLFLPQGQGSVLEAALAAHGHSPGILRRWRDYLVLQNNFAQS